MKQFGLMINKIKGSDMVNLLLRLNKLQQIDNLKNKSSSGDEKEIITRRMKKRMIRILKTEILIKEIELEQSRKNIELLEKLLDEENHQNELAKFINKRNK